MQHSAFIATTSLILVWCVWTLTVYIGGHHSHKRFPKCHCYMAIQAIARCYQNKIIYLKCRMIYDTNCHDCLTDSSHNVEYREKNLFLFSLLKVHQVTLQRNTVLPKHCWNGMITGSLKIWSSHLVPHSHLRPWRETHHLTK